MAQQQEQKLRQQQFVGQLREVVRSHRQSESLSKNIKIHQGDNSILSTLLDPQFPVQAPTDEDVYRRRKTKKRPRYGS